LYSPILHDLTLSRFLAVATKYFQAHSDYTLLETRTCYQLTPNPPCITVTRNGKTSTIVAIPDAWLHIERVEDGKGYPLWCEIDRGTENHQKFKRLVRNRLAVAKSPQYEKMFNTKAVLFCYVTTGTLEQAELRLHNMLRWTEEVLPHRDLLTKEEKLTEEEKKRLAERGKLASLFRFATVEYEKMYDQPHRLFTDPVWYQPDEPDPVPLLASVTQPNQQETGHGQGEIDANGCQEHNTTSAVEGAEASRHDNTHRPARLHGEEGAY
jgi:hypothetical protein